MANGIPNLAALLGGNQLGAGTPVASPEDRRNEIIAALMEAMNQREDLPVPAAPTTGQQVLAALGDAFRGAATRGLGRPQFTPQLDAQRQRRSAVQRQNVQAGNVAGRQAAVMEAQLELEGLEQQERRQQREGDITRAERIRREDIDRSQTESRRQQGVDVLTAAAANRVLHLMPPELIAQIRTGDPAALSEGLGFISRRPEEIPAGTLKREDEAFSEGVGFIQGLLGGMKDERGLVLRAGLIERLFADEDPEAIQAEFDRMLTLSKPFLGSRAAELQELWNTLVLPHLERARRFNAARSGVLAARGQRAPQQQTPRDQVVGFEAGKQFRMR
jgi:hypothetical protein